MQIDSIRLDENFLAHQKKIYSEFNEKTRMEVKMVAKMFDYDLKSHIEQLEAH